LGVQRLSKRKDAFAITDKVVLILLLALISGDPVQLTGIVHLAVQTQIADGVILQILFFAFQPMRDGDVK
jgi:hypothetical protein